MGLLIRAPQISGFDPRLVSVRPSYPSQPFAALPHPIVQGPRCSPGCHFDLDRWSYLAPLICCSLPVLVVDDVHVHRHLARFVLSKINSAPAHHAPVVDAPLPTADVSRLKPHSSIRTRMRLIANPQPPAVTNKRSVTRNRPIPVSWSLSSFAVGVVQVRGSQGRRGRDTGSYVDRGERREVRAWAARTVRNLGSTTLPTSSCPG